MTRKPTITIGRTLSDTFAGITPARPRTSYCPQLVTI
jgi:hypothetical protein